MIGLTGKVNGSGGGFSGCICFLSSSPDSAAVGATDMLVLMGAVVADAQKSEAADQKEKSICC